VTKHSSHMAQAPEVIVVGGGLAGLAAARALAAHAIPVQLLEASAEVGGRVATDEVDGFLLDRGFQVLLDSYPEARRVLDMPALDLHPFAAGALIRRGDRMGRVADPWRDPLAGVRSLVSGAFTPADAWRMMRLRSDALLGASRDPDAATQTTARALADRGFSDRAIESFFRPFFGGVFLDAQLSAPRTWFEFLFGMFATGSATLPAQGMRAIPRQLASALPAGTVRTSARVRSVRADGVELDGGETIRARAVIIATDARHLAVLVPGTRAPSWVGCATLYYAAPASPLGEPVLLLNGEPRTGPVNHVCVPSDVTAGYAPPGQHLVSATTIGVPSGDDATVDREARAQLTRWFGARAVDAWRLLRVSRVAHTLPRFTPGLSVDRAVRLGDGLYACGDHLETPSINGALRSGRRAAEALLQDWGVRGGEAVA
jgi:phytoene dehydrogenase-like protein